MYFMRVSVLSPGYVGAPVPTSTPALTLLDLPGGPGGLTDRGVDPVEQVGERDHQNDRGQFLLVEVVGRRGPDLIGDRVRPVRQPRRGLGQRKRRTLGVREQIRLAPGHDLVQPLV